MGIHVFAYGSLMWNPGFSYVKSRPALLDGWKRVWCVKSTFYRGCEDNPGYVLGLKKGGSCVGILFDIDEREANATLDCLDIREMRESGYIRQSLSVLDAEGIRTAYSYTSDALPEPCHAAFSNAYRHSKGVAGPNRDYVDRTCAFLSEFQIPDRWPRPHSGLPDSSVF